MKYFSMFSGIGGFEYGIEKAWQSIQGSERGSVRPIGDKSDPKVRSNEQPEARRDREFQQPENIGYSEIDKYAIKVYERNFNGHINYGNATTINATELPDFDLLVGGFPCQAFSIAGKRAGFDDTRGTLFFDIARILKEKQPRNLVLENVKGLLSHDGGRTFTTIIGVLADLGYFVEWQVLNSKDFGVPQNRERVFIVGHLGGQPRRKVFPIGQSGKTPVEYRGQGAGVFSNALDSSYYKGHDGKRQLIAEPRIRRLTPLECERLQGFPDNWTKEGVELCQGKLCAAGKVDACLGHFVEISDTQRYKMCGNAVTTNVVEAVMTNLRRAM